MLNYFKKFKRCEHGGMVTIEAVIWLPLYLYILTACVDATVMMKAQTDLWAVASNSARMVSVNAMTPTEAEDYANGLLSNGETVQVNISVDNGNVTSTVVRQTADVARFGLMAWAVPAITVSTTQRVEPTA